MKKNDFISDVQLNFIEGLTGRVEGIEQVIISIETLEQDKIQQVIRHLLGEFHSIKGSASAFQFKTIQLLCHKVEDIVIATQQPSEIIKQVDTLLKYCDAINEYANTYKLQRHVSEDEFLKKHSVLFEDAQHEKIIDNKNSLQLRINLKVLVVDISFSLMNNLKKYITNYNLKLSFSHNSNDALTRISMEKFDLIISSYFTEPLNGLNLCMAIKNQWKEKNIKFVICPSQKIDPELLKNRTNFLPDHTIIKDQDMYKNFSDYCNETFNFSDNIKKILFMDDENSLLDLYKMVTEDRTDCEILYLQPSADYLNTIRDFSPDLIVSDINMPNINVLDIMDYFYVGTEKKTKFIFLTGDVNNPICQQLSEKGALTILDKSVLLDDLLGHLSKIGVNIVS